MNVLPVGIALCLVSVHAFAAGNPSLYANLTDLNQNPAFRPKLPAAPASSFKLAKVHFVVDTADKIGFDDIEQSFDHNNAQRCKDLGFAQTAACAANQFKARLCPYDDAYYDRCCDNDYKYTKGECSYPNTISSTSCGGKYKCYCDTALYPYTSANCPAPKELSDKCVDASGAHYAECKCPSYYKPCDASKNLVGVGEACPGNGETVYAACECESGYNQVCEQFGPANANDYCLNGGKFYKTCKTSADWCFANGYKNNANIPCNSNEKIADVCPKNTDYYNCRIDPDKYCSNNGYTKKLCSKYQDDTNVCIYDNSYHKCVETCKSRIYAALGGKVNFDGFNLLNGSDIPMVYTQDSTDDITTERGGIYRSNKSYDYSECQVLPTPTVTTRNAAGSTLGGVDLRDFELHYKVPSSETLVHTQGNSTFAGMIIKPVSNNGSVYSNSWKFENVTSGIGVKMNILPGHNEAVTDISAFNMIYLAASAIKVKSNAALKASHIHFSTWANFIIETGAKPSTVASLYMHNTSYSELSIAKGTVLNITGELAQSDEYNDVPELRNMKIGLFLAQPNGQGEASGAPIQLNGKINLTNNMAIYSEQGPSTMYIGEDADFYFNDIYMQNNTGLAIDHIGSAKSGCIYSSRWGKSIKANSDNDYCSIFGKNAWLVSGGGAPWNGAGASWNGVCNYTNANRCN